MHGGDLAHAGAFLSSLAPDEVFLAVNGDTIVEYDAPALARLAAGVDARTPVMVLGERSDTGSLRVWPDGRLAGIGDVDYEMASRDSGLAPSAARAEDAAGAPDEERWDDLGMRLLHASVRQYLPPAGAEMSLHGAGGLIGEIAAAGRRSRVVAAPAIARAEIGTVAEYEARESNVGLRELADRLIPISAGHPA